MKNQIIHGDALEELPKLPDNSIDLILTDPPYNISTNNQITRNGGKFGRAKNINLSFGEWDYSRLVPTDYIDEFARVLKSNGVLCLFYDKLYLGIIGLYLQEKYDFQVRHIGSWIKTNPAPQARKVNWQSSVENFLVATANKGSGHHFNYKLGQSPDYFKTSVNYEHLHPTQKPVELFSWIIRYWSFEGDTVLDPFIGSGTTAVSALANGRNFIGIEIDKNYVDMAYKRIEPYLKQEKLTTFVE